MANTKRKPPTPEEQRQARIAELDAVEGMRQADQQRRLEMKAASDDFMARAEAARTARQAAIEAGTYEPPVIPTIQGIYEEKAAQEREAEAAAEAERLAAISPRDTLISTLPYIKQQAI